MITSSVGAFCLSVDCSESETLSIETARRHREFVAILNEMKIPSNWTMTSNAVPLLPAQAEIGACLPRATEHGAIVHDLRTAKAHIIGLGGTFSTIAADPSQARQWWHLLVRQGLTVVRPRTAELLPDGKPTTIRGGLVLAPISCSFVGGSQRSVGALAKVCQRKLMDAVSRGQLFHVHVDLGQPRDSWQAEFHVLKELMLYAYHEKAKGDLQFSQLSSLPTLLGVRRTGKAMDSILRVAS